MTPRRRQPPLFEALGEPPRRIEHGPPAASSPTSNGTPRPTAIIEPRPSATSPGAPTGPAWAQNRSRLVLLLIPVLLAIVVAVWTLAYNKGHEVGQQSVLQHTDPNDAAVITGQKPTNVPASELPPVSAAANPSASKASTGKAAAPKPPPTPTGMPSVAAADPRKPGYNYLEICPLMWKDAEPAVRFLQSNGVRATAVPLDKVDLASLKPNDRFLVLVDQPFPSGEGFRAALAEREQLIAKVRRLGKQYQTDKRGASDFADPMFRLQRGGK